MKVVIVKDKKEFNKFLKENKGSFLQSFEWGEFQEDFSNYVLRFFVKDKDEIKLACTLFSKQLYHKKSFLYIPYGPVVKKGEHIDILEKAYKRLFDYLQKEVKDKNDIFLKIEQENSPVNLVDFGFKKSKKDIQARETMIMNLSLSENELLKRMKQKTRYNIRLAERKGVRIFQLEEKESAFDIFYKLLHETSQRNKFGIHPKEYYEKLVENYFGKQKGKDFFVKIFFAEYEGEVITSALIGYFNKRATFLYGGSSDKYKNVMTPYLLHWEIIKDAKQDGFLEYDFWGIVTEKTDKRKVEKWKGFSNFKKGFCGEIVELPGAYDFVYSKFWYALYSFDRLFRRN